MPNPVRYPTRQPIRRWTGRLAALILFSAILFPGTGLAQLTDDSTTSTLGTQFVGPDPEKKPSQPPPAEKVVPAKPAKPPPAAISPPPPPKQPAKPPLRYPSVIFLVDTSDSMQNLLAGGGRRQIDEAKRALTGVLQGMSPVTRVQIWTFNTAMIPILVKGVPKGRFIPIGKGNYREALIEKVRRFRTTGGTNLYQSIIKALAFFANKRDQAAYRSRQRFPVLVVLSDGEDGGKTRETLDSVLQEKSKFPLVTINAIGFNLAENTEWLGILCRIATHAKGCATADDGPQLQRMLESFYRPRLNRVSKAR